MGLRESGLQVPKTAPPISHLYLKWKLLLQLLLHLHALLLFILISPINPQYSISSLFLIVVPCTSISTSWFQLESVK